MSYSAAVCVQFYICGVVYVICRHNAVYQLKMHFIFQYNHYNKTIVYVIQV